MWKNRVTYTLELSAETHFIFFKCSKHGPQGVGSKPRGFARIGAFSPKITGGAVFEASNVNWMLARDSSWLIQKFSFGLVTNFENSCKTCRERGKRRVKLDLLCFKKNVMKTKLISLIRHRSPQNEQCTTIKTWPPKFCQWWMRSLLARLCESQRRSNFLPPPNWLFHLRWHPLSGRACAPAQRRHMK